MCHVCYPTTATAPPAGVVATTDVAGINVSTAYVGNGYDVCLFDDRDNGPVAGNRNHVVASAGDVDVARGHHARYAAMAPADLLAIIDAAYARWQDNDR